MSERCRRSFLKLARDKSRRSLFVSWPSPIPYVAGQSVDPKRRILRLSRLFDSMVEPVGLDHRSTRRVESQALALFNFGPRRADLVCVIRRTVGFRNND